MQSQLAAAAAQGGEERALTLVPHADGAFDRGPERQPALAAVEDLLHELYVALRVAPMATVAALGPREPVPGLPHAQRRLGDAGPLGDVADRERAGRLALAHAAASSDSRALCRPSRVRLLAVPSGMSMAWAISRAVRPPPKASRSASRCSSGSMSRAL